MLMWKPFAATLVLTLALALVACGSDAGEAPDRVITAMAEVQQWQVMYLWI